jgi:hypothetical protein
MRLAGGFATDPAGVNDCGELEHADNAPKRVKLATIAPAYANEIDNREGFIIDLPRAAALYLFDAYDALAACTSNQMQTKRKNRHDVRPKHSNQSRLRLTPHNLGLTGSRLLQFSESGITLA